MIGCTSGFLVAFIIRFGVSLQEVKAVVAFLAVTVSAPPQTIKLNNSYGSKSMCQSYDIILHQVGNTFFYESP